MITIACYSSCGLYFLKHFVAALTNVGTVKPAQLPLLNVLTWHG